MRFWLQRVDYRPAACWQPLGGFFLISLLFIGHDCDVAPADVLVLDLDTGWIIALFIKRSERLFQERKKGQISLQYLQILPPYRQRMYRQTNGATLQSNTF